MANKTASVKIRLDPGEKSSFQKAANFAGLTFSAWVRERLRRVARLELEEAGEKVSFSSPPPEIALIKNSETEILQKAVEKTYDCTAKFVESLPVQETCDGKTLGEKTVFVFALAGHSLAQKCYAWSSSPGESAQTCHYTALHLPPIDSPETAVRAAMLLGQKMKYGLTG
ncbi:MAG: hypothetical protein ACOZF2_16315 [Thermodesulfobacteriota bacterium]